LLYFNAKYLAKGERKMTTPVNKVNGIGPKTTVFLRNQNITTVEALIKFGVAKLALAPGFSKGRAVTVINEAKILIGSAQSQATAKSSSKVKTKSEKPDKKGKKNKKNKKSKNKKGKKDKKDKKKDKKKNKK